MAKIAGLSNYTRMWNKALYNQLISSTPSNLLKKLQDTILGLGQVTFLQMLMHLRETYGKITKAELDHNEKTSVDFTINIFCDAVSQSSVRLKFW